MNITAIQNSFNLIGNPTLPLQEQLKLGIYADRKRLLYFTANSDTLLQIGNYNLFAADDATAIENIAAIFNTDLRLQQNFSSVTLFYDGDFELIPDTFFIQNQSSLADKTFAEVHLAYQPDFDISPVLRQHFSTIQKTHSGTALINSLISENTDGKTNFYTLVHPDFLDIVVFDENKKLLFYNRYSYKTPTDFIYYILLVCDFLQIDRSKQTLYLLGEISSNSAIYTICYRYFEKTVLLRPTGNIAFGEGFADFPIHIHYHLYSTLLCALSEVH